MASGASANTPKKSSAGTAQSGPGAPGGGPAGGGMFQTRDSFFGQDSTHTEGAFTAGGGVRAAVSNRVTVGVDARIGWEAHLRVNGVVGIRLGR